MKAKGKKTGPKVKGLSKSQEKMCSTSISGMEWAREDLGAADLPNI